jgi:Mor family transcriptional regulator
LFEQTKKLEAQVKQDLDGMKYPEFKKKYFLRKIKNFSLTFINRLYIVDSTVEQKLNKT